MDSRPPKPHVQTTPHLPDPATVKGATRRERQRAFQQLDRFIQLLAGNHVDECQQ